MDPNDTLVTPLLFPLVNIEVQSQPMQTGTKEYDDVVHEFGTLHIDFSKLALGEVYAIHYASTTEIRIQDNSLAYQATKQQKKEKSQKALLRKKGQ